LSLRIEVSNEIVSRKTFSQLNIYLSSYMLMTVLDKYCRRSVLWHVFLSFHWCHVVIPMLSSWKKRIEFYAVHCLKKRHWCCTV